MARAVVITRRDPARPPLEIFAELVRRGERLTIYAQTRHRQAIEAFDAIYRSYGDLTEVVEAVRQDRPDYLIFDAAVWGGRAAEMPRLPAVTYCTVATPGACYGDLNLVLIPRALQVDAGSYGQGFRFVGRCRGDGPDGGDPGEVPWDELGPDPLIYISLAGIAGDRRGFFGACAEAFGSLPFEVVVAGAEIGPTGAPANFRLVDAVPLAKLMARTTLAIGGADADLVEECVRAGVPQLMYPEAGDAALLALRVEQLGAGLRLEDAGVKGARLRQLAGRMMADPAYCRAAERLRESIGECGGAAEACSEILAFAQGIT